MIRPAQTIGKCGTKAFRQSGNQHYETSHFLSQLCFFSVESKQSGYCFYLGRGGGEGGGGGESVKEYELKVTFPRFFLVFTLKNNKPLKFSRFVFPKYWGI